MLVDKESSSLKPCSWSKVVTDRRISLPLGALMTLGAKSYFLAVTLISPAGPGWSVLGRSQKHSEARQQHCGEADMPPVHLPSSLVGECPYSPPYAPSGSTSRDSHRASSAGRNAPGTVAGRVVHN